MPAVGQFSDSSNPQQMLCSQKSVELYEEKGVSRTKRSHTRTAVKYISPGFRSVKACSIGAAAVIFAERAARKHYGKSGYCRTCTQVAHSTDGRSAEYSAFITHTLRGQRKEAIGHNHPFVVYAAIANQPTKPYPGNPRRVFSGFLERPMLA